MKNRFFKKLICIVIAAFMLMSLGACQSKTNDNKASKEGASSLTSADKKFSIVCTTFPQYDWVKQILGDKASDYKISLLLDNGVDLHSYQPTAEDIVNIGSADIFIYVGGESDKWVDDALKEKSNPNLKAINLLDVLGDAVKEEEVKEGMQAEEEEEAEEGEEEEVEYDEHVWLSVKNAKVLVNEIASELENLDKDNADLFKENAAKYIVSLDDLDKQYEDAVASAKFNTVVFADRFPFRYLVEDYKLDYYAAFVGCSAESEASFETITFLSSKVDQLGLKSVLVIETSDKKIAEQVVANTKNKDAKILVMDSLQSISSQELNGEKTYLGVMAANLEVLKEALN